MEILRDTETLPEERFWYQFADMHKIRYTFIYQKLTISISKKLLGPAKVPQEKRKLNQNEKFSKVWNKKLRDKYMA